MITLLRHGLFSVFCLSLFLAAPSTNAETTASRLSDDIAPLLACLSGERQTFTLHVEIDAEIGGNRERIEAKVSRFGGNDFDVDVTHKDYAIQVRRRAEITALALPLHNKVFLGRGETDASDHLGPAGIAQRLISPHSQVATYAQVLQAGEPGAVAFMLTNLANLQFDPSTSTWKQGDKTSIQFSEAGGLIDARSDETRVRLVIKNDEEEAAPIGAWPEMKVVELSRDELERQLVRGIRRASEILAPASRLTSPARVAKRVDHGELRWIDGQRVAILHGTPDQIGKAHGDLLREEAQRCIDSVLYTFGTAQTINTGRWFRHDLDSAYARLEPHIPDRHKTETRALATSLGLTPRLVESLNVFPELFHCSGFAVFGKATTDGTLYHGRVLDYMTTIGLQDAATTFIVAPQGQHSFANVGYAGFVGSVSGMNSRSISLGEMGGKGEGQWDGVPMATLMRRALEECSTLDEVKELWSNSPRTCEYYYVFADGKTNRAVGVAATPESIEFVEPGQAHELLGEGIEDAVVLSAGSRLETLRERVLQRHGKIDENVAQWLMSRPVAMESNLHNVLFVPAKGLLFVANASHDQPAAERPYMKLDLNALLQQLPVSAPATPVAALND
ncbi:MAG: C45 family autoproteolytic acyltransferase/hydrolase [Rubripirellula sp.]